MKVDEKKATEGMGYFVCSDCDEPIVVYGKDDAPHVFDRRECGCDGGSPEHGWRFLQQEEVSDAAEGV